MHQYLFTFEATKFSHLAQSTSEDDSFGSHLVFQLGLMSSYAVWAVSRSFSMFLLFRVIGGICKGNVSLCTAIVADLPCPKARNRGMVGTCAL